MKSDVGLMLDSVLGPRFTMSVPMDIKFGFADVVRVLDDFFLDEATQDWA